MNWKIRFALLAAAAIPAFTGFPLHALDGVVFPGVTVGWLGYFWISTLLILAVLGPRHLAGAVSVASLVTVPVIFVGGSISALLVVAGGGDPGEATAYSVHYVSLCVTMLTVIPLALSLAAVVPFHDIEQNLLLNPAGVSRPEKYLLMFLRVFNHIIFSVIPGILEVMREENRFRFGAGGDGAGNGAAGIFRGPGRLRLGFIELIRAMTRIGIEGICASVQYLALWAVEISQLPDRPARKR